MSINFSNEAKMAGSDHHIEPRGHGRGYSQIRMWLRTVLLSSLLVLSHEIVSRLAAVGASYSAEALSAFRSLSPLIFLTLLWIGFTLLEMSDSPRPPCAEYDGVEVESWAIFERTWMEFVLNSILLSGWIISAARCINVPDFIHFGVLPISLITATSAVMGLQLQMVLSIAYHAVCQGPRSVLTSRFWNERSGHWDRRIMLDEGM